MKILCFISLATICSAAACFCGLFPVPCASHNSNASQSANEEVDFPDPDGAPQYNPLDFGYAEIDDDDKDNVQFYRPMFVFRQQTRTENRTKTVIDTVVTEYTDANGKKRTKSQDVERPEEYTIEVASTVVERQNDQILICPISSLSAFDRNGAKLTTDQIRTKLAKCRRALLQGVGCTGDAYYGGFIDSDVLFLQSNAWVNTNPASPMPEVSK